MSYNNYSQTKTFKIVKDGDFSDNDLKWIKSLSNVSVVSQQKNIIRVESKNDDEVQEIVDSINTRYCTCLKPKLNPLFCVYTQPPSKHKKYNSAVKYDHSPLHF